MAKHKGNAPVVNNGIYREMHKQVNKTGRQMKRVREEGYGGLDSAIRGIYKNTLSTQKGFAKDLEKANSRTLRKILEHTANSRKSNRRLTHATDKRLEAFGGGAMMAEGMAERVNTLNRQRKNDARVANVGARSVGVIADAAQSASDIMEAGTREAGANAQTLAAEAFSQRTNEDLALISQQHHDIAMQKLQHIQQMAQLEKQAEIERKQLKWQQKQAEKAFGSETMNNVLQPQVATMQAIIPAILRMRGEGMNAAEIKAALLEQELIMAGEENTPAINSIVRTLTTDTQAGDDREKLAQEVLTALKSQPEWASLTPKQEKQLRDYVMKNVTLSYTERQLNALGSGGGGGGFWDDPLWGVAPQMLDDVDLNLMGALPLLKGL